MRVWILVFLSYLAGSFPTAYVVARKWAGLDIRTVGSGNVGAGNVTRTLGLRLGSLVAAVDYLKGLVPVMVGRNIGLSSSELVPVGVAAVAGHNWPVFLQFRGGRGMATGAGVLSYLFPRAIPVLVVTALVGSLKGVGGLTGILGFSSVPLLAVIWGESRPVLWASLSVLVLVAVRRIQGSPGDRLDPAHPWRSVLHRLLYDSSRPLRLAP